MEDTKILMSAVGGSARKFILNKAYKIGGKALREKVKKDLAEIKISFIYKEQ